MKRTLVLILAGVITVGPAVAVQKQAPQAAAPQQAASDAQEPVPTFKVPEKSRSFTSAELLQKFEEGSDEEYTLAAGDEITIEMWDHPELSGKHTVGPDGKVTLSEVGVITLAGLSRDAASEAVKTAYSRDYIDPVVTVRVDKYLSNHVYVLGRVSHPGALDFQTPPTLLEAISLAGGLPIGGVGAEKAALSRCAVFRGRNAVVWVEFRKLLTGSNLGLNLRLRRNDVVYIPDSDDQLVYVLGEVHTPGAYHLTPTMTLLGAIALAGGPTKDAAKGKVQLIRQTGGIFKQLSFDKLIKPDGDLNYSLNQGDIIYVPRSGLAKINYMFERIAPLTTLLLLFSSVGN